MMAAKNLKELEEVDEHNFVERLLLAKEGLKDIDMDREDVQMLFNVFLNLMETFTIKKSLIQDKIDELELCDSSKDGKCTLEKCFTQECDGKKERKLECEYFHSYNQSEIKVLKSFLTSKGDK